MTLSDPSNNATPLGTVRTDAFGVFSLPISFSKQQPLGYYTIDAKGANGNDINGSLRVAEFKPPNFKLTLTLGATSATAGSSVHANVAAAYLFGAPLQGGTAHAYVTRDVATVAPKGWDDFSFGPQWYYPEQTPSFDTDVLQRDLPLDAQGDDVARRRRAARPAVSDDVSVDMETSDVSNLSVSDSQSFFALPSDAVIGWRRMRSARRAARCRFASIVTDADGTADFGALRSLRAAEDDLRFGDAGSRRRRKRAAGDQVRYRGGRRRHLRRQAGQRAAHSARRGPISRLCEFRRHVKRRELTAASRSSLRCG